MNKIARTLACAASALAVVSAWAQLGELAEESDEAPETAAEESSGEEAEPSADGEALAAPAAAKAPEGKAFHLLPLCMTVDGRGEVMAPGSSDWTEVEEGKFYPLGCSFRTVGADSRMSVMFGPESEVSLSGDSSFGSLPAKIGERQRVIALLSGKMSVKLPRNLAPGLFSVTAMGFTAYDLSGESRYSYVRTGDGDSAIVRCVTGLMSVKGRHFDIPKMTVANELKIRTSQDLLFTGLYGNSGDFVVRLDQGIVSITDFETKEEKIEQRTLDWHLSPKTAVRIHRAMPTIGEKMSVTVMTFDASGELRNRCAFTEGRAEINTGEQGVGALADQEAERAKKAAEAADAVSEEEGDEDEGGEDDGDSGTEASSSDDSGDDVF